MKKYEDIVYADRKECILDVYIPDCEKFPVFVYFHGGGLESLDKKFDKFYENLVSKGVAIVTADYRMYPNAKFPDFLVDSAEAVSWAYKNMSKYGEVTGYFVGGSSAGGYISQMLCFDKQYLAKHGIDADKVDGYVLDAGQPTVHFNVLRERGLDTRRVIVDEASALYHITADRDYAPMQIIYSEFDMENRPEQTRLLCSTLKHFGYAEKIDLRFMEKSGHCEYVNKQDENGNWIFADMVYEFISNLSK